jgi:nitroimidazol reductase NimA-like FMN-containing flavoprotein (pyridoxamine 5'-phosphate oxidase superfamily)
MRTNPRVCVEVDEIVDRFNWTTVVVKGRYEELTKSPAHQAARKRAYLLFENRPDWWYPAAGKTRSADVRTPVIYRIQVEGISGRLAARDLKKIVKTKPDPASTKAPTWWSHVLRPLQGPPAGFK